jgi:hypothetical protein
MEGRIVKHVKLMTRKVPSNATTAEEITCAVAQFLSALLGAFGGASPVLDFITGKCPEVDDTNTTA